jgi:hypothetical protein
MSAWRERVSRIGDGSTVGTVFDSLGESHLVSGMETVRGNAARIARHSFLFQWLTNEPGPEVIVIEFRKTRTVGPLIVLLDWAIARLRPYWEETALKRGLDSLVTLGERVAETRVGMTLAQVFSPLDRRKTDETRISDDVGSKHP